jgi:hypothetical protein
MEWQCGGRARRDHEQAALVIHDRFDRAKQRCIELVGKRKVEQAGFAGGIAGAADIEPLAQRGHLLRQRVRADRDLLPVEAIAGDRGDVALLLGQRKQHHRFIAGEQCLDVLHVKRQRIRQRGVIRKLVRERLLQARAPRGNGRQPFALSARRIMGAGLGNRRHDRLVQRVRLRREILIPAHELGEAVASCGEPHRELVHG